MFTPKNLDNKDYISLNIHDNASIPRGSSRSIWRQWNQLSRFQRNILYFIVLTVVLVLFYIVHAKYRIVTLDEISKYDDAASQFTVRSVENLDVDEKERINGLDDRDVIDEPQQEVFQPEVNQIHDNQIREPPPPKSNAHKFNGPRNDKQKAVLRAFMHSWNGYKNYAWGHDNVKPLTKGYHDWFGLGLTVVDAIDTMYIMGLSEEFAKARSWIESNLIFNQNKDVNLFEVTIRVLGGLLAAYHLSDDKLFLNKALDLGERMMPAFSTPSNVPYSDVNLGTRTAHSPKWGPDSSTSEVTSIQLEFRDLSRCTGQPRFETAVAKVSAHIHRQEKYDGLVPIFVNANTGQFRDHATITFGARGDSYYEYLLKQWLQTGKTIDYLRDDYLSGISGAQKHLVKRTAVNKYLFISELVGVDKTIKPKMDHLTCYLAGTLALGAHNGLPNEHMSLAEELTKTCFQTYANHPTFLAPEITYFNIQKSEDESHMDMYVKSNDAHNLLRPELIESLYYMWYFTGNRVYQDWGWRIFQAFENYTKVENGYTSIGNVQNIHNTRPQDMTESFWFAETLKYLYLLFDDSRELIDLDEWVFNSEGHPLPIYRS